MIYADFEYYTGTYLGNAVLEEDFPRLALRASQFLDYYTQGRAEKNADLPAVQMACCALVEQYQAIDQAQRLSGKALRGAIETSGQEAKSQTVGPLSVTYSSGGESASAAAAAAKNAREALADIARQYLAGTGLLYRGGGGCRCRCSHIL